MAGSADMLPIEVDAFPEASPTFDHSVVPAHQSQVASHLHKDERQLELEQIRQYQIDSLIDEGILDIEGLMVDGDLQSDGGNDTSQTQTSNADNQIPEPNPDGLTDTATQQEPSAQEDPSYQRKMELQTLQSRLAGMEKENASLLEANGKLNVALNGIEGQSTPGTPSMVMWHDHQTAALIQNLKKRLLALRRTIDEAVRALSRTIINQLHPTGDAASQDYGDVVKLVGEPLARLLGDTNQRFGLVNHHLVQTVFQIFLTNLCASKIDLFSPNDPEVSDFYLALYRKILDSEGSDVAGNWRALIHANTGIDVVGWEADTMAGLMAILRVANWGAGEQEHLHSFANKLKRIFYMVKKIRIAIREKITSVQIEVSYVPFSSQFSPQFMVDAWPEQEETAVPPELGQVQCVIGTIAFGLKQLVEGERKPSGDLVYWNIMSPDVILEYSVQSILARMRGPRIAWKA